MTLDKLLNRSVAQSPHMGNGNNDATNIINLILGVKCVNIYKILITVLVHNKTV